MLSLVEKLSSRSTWIKIPVDDTFLSMMDVFFLHGWQNKHMSKSLNPHVPQSKEQRGGVQGLKQRESGVGHAFQYGGWIPSPPIPSRRWNLEPQPILICWAHGHWAFCPENFQILELFSINSQRWFWESCHMSLKRVR